MRRAGIIIALILILGIVPTWAIKPVQAATYVPLVELNQNFNSYLYSDVLTSGIVTYRDNNGFFIQNGTGPYTGIYVYTGYKSYPNVEPGQIVEVYGYAKYYNGLKELSVNPTYGEYYTVIGSGTVPEPTVVSTGEVNQEKWQGVLVKFVDAKITDRYDRGYTKIWIDDGSGEALVFFSSSASSDLQPGAKFKYVTGVVYVYSYTYEILPISYQLYNPAVKITDVEYYAFIKDVPSRVKATVFNSGTNPSNVTFVVKFDDTIVYSEDFDLQSGETRIVEFYVIPTSLGGHTLTIIAEESEKIFTIEVIPNPNVVAYGITPYYERLYSREMSNLTELYENFTYTVNKLRQYGVDFGDLEPKIQWINETMAEIQREYTIYDSLKGLLIQQNPYRMAYYFPVMAHIRKAALLSREVVQELEFVLPHLQRVLKEVETIYQPPAPGNETNVTENQTNITPSTNISITITKVLIDASHGQYYNPTKTDTSGMQTLIENIQNELGWIVDINTEPITYEKLKEYDIFIITNPSQDITDEEAQAIQQFVENGGGLFILGENYYNHVYYKSLNKVVSKYGIEFNNDELMDDDVNTGRKWFPLVGIYNLDHPAMQFLTADHQMYYSGDTLTVSGNVVWLVRGYETSYSVDKDGNVIYEKGSKPIIAAAVEVGSGRIVAYGSSKAISDSYYGNYINTNWPFVKGVLLWLAHEI
ncbi:Gldg family protein [Thermococcus sp. GR6]|uniref:DUF4350 domain-containing protein n=1 Tax=Thermococcus sp. GR6 TaxID=1638256 RepID=UPI00351A73AF